MQQTLKQQYKCNHTACLDFAGTQQRCKPMNWKSWLWGQRGAAKALPRARSPQTKGCSPRVHRESFFSVFLKERHRSLGNCFSFLPLHLHRQKLAYSFWSNPRSRQRPREHPGTARHRGCPTIPPPCSYLTLAFKPISVAIQTAATPQHTPLTSLPGCVFIVTNNY